MNMGLGKSLTGFDAALRQLSDTISAWPELSLQLFANTEEWRKLLRYKLLPHLEGEGCLIVAVAGGTNTGKSTAFNLLLEEDVSPMRTTAAATCRPLLAANSYRTEQCLAGKLMPEFSPTPLTDRELLVSGDAPEDVLFVVTHAAFPDRLAVLDIPDVDSIDKQNWQVAESIQAAGDVLIAVLTGEKYKDDRVVAFFRQAQASGRVIIPLMNKANPADDYSVAQAQLADFCAAVELPEDTPCFVLPHDFSLAEDLTRPIASLQGAEDLRGHLQALDASEIKVRVYQDSVRCFAEQTTDFLERLDEIAESLRSVLAAFEARAQTCAAAYDPEPDAQVGALLHTFVQGKRGMLSRTVGQVGRAMGRLVTPLGGVMGRALRRRMALELTEDKKDGEALTEKQRREVQTRCRDFIRELLQGISSVSPLAQSLIGDAFEQIDVDALVAQVVSETVSCKDISEDFREHVEATLNVWWGEHAIRRHVLLELDTLLVLSPTAVAVPLALYSGGVGAPEVIAATGPLAGEFFSRILEHQFADKWFDLMEPWRREQQEKFAQALLKHVVHVGLSAVYEAYAALGVEVRDELRRYQQQCRQAC